MAMKRCSVFLKAPVLLEPHHQIVSCQIQDTHWWGGGLPLCKEAVSVFYSPSQLGKTSGEQWQIGTDGERESRESMLSPHLDDDISYSTVNTCEVIVDRICSLIQLQSSWLGRTVEYTDCIYAMGYDPPK